MIGQHAFESQKTYDQPKYFRDIHAWLVEGMGIPLKDIVYHEDAWAGGGNFGCSLEFFSGGLEIGNQVYTMYERVGDSLRPLEIKVLDMGMGQERPAWFSHGTPTAYEPNFPTVMEKLFGIAGISRNGEEKETMARFLPYSGLLNMDDVEDLDKAWEEIARKIDVDVLKLRSQVLMGAGLYSIADHSRGLLFALTDGGLPSNSGGGYNLRLIYRRAMDFIRKYGWDVDMADVCRWHAEYLKPQFPEMLEAVDEVAEILENERAKYIQTKEMALATVKRLKEKEARVSVDDLLKLYDSKGITPDLLVAEGLDVKVPGDFFAQVAALHEKSEAAAKTQKAERIEMGSLPETGVLYYSDYLALDFDTEVLAVVGNNIVLGETAFYPTSGGQLNDVGSLEGPTSLKVLDTFKQDSVIIHRVEGNLAGWKLGIKVKGHVDKARRVQLAQHHTVTHIINGVCRRVLGNHIWQAGAEKTEEKGRLDITHFDSLSQAEIVEIEGMANKIIGDSIPVESMILPKNEAEKRFGFRLYQGGAIPGHTLRVLRIDDLDTEACGGTHLGNTSEAVRVTILGTKKIQDGIVRIEYVAGNRAREIFESDMATLTRVMAVIGTSDPNAVEKSCADIFALWKYLRKAAGKVSTAPEEQRQATLDEVLGKARSDPAFSILEHYRAMGRPKAIDDVPPKPGSDIARPHEYIASASAAFKVQKEHLGRTLIRFLADVDAWLVELGI
jgi:alanyl-tRNA synthetase